TQRKCGETRRGTEAVWLASRGATSKSPCFSVPLRTPSVLKPLCCGLRGIWPDAPVGDSALPPLSGHAQRARLSDQRPSSRFCLLLPCSARGGALWLCALRQ